jgi:hypothetical protein
VLHAHAVLDPPPPLELAEAGGSHVGADHRGVVGDRHEERAVVGVAGPEQRVDLEHGPARVGGVDRDAVVDDPLEHGQGADPHGGVSMAAVERYAHALADAVDETVAGWVERSVERVLVAWRGTADPGVMARARAAAEEARGAVMAELRPLLDADIDDQRSTPLTILRRAVRFPTEVLREAGVPPVVRDDDSARRFPEDDYDLTPASFADVDPSLHDHGIAWGAAKAHTHLRRHRPDPPA